MRQPPRSWGLVGSLALACALLAAPVGADMHGDAEAQAEEATAEDAEEATAEDAEEAYADEDEAEEAYTEEDADEESADDEYEYDDYEYDDDESDEQEELEFAEPGFYLSGLATAAFATRQSDMRNMAQDGASSLDGFRQVSSDLEDLNWGMNARIGYRINPRLSAEGEFEWIRRFEIDTTVRFDDDTRRETSTDIRFVTATANGKYHFLTGRTQPYVLAGAGWGWSTMDQVGQNTKERDDGFVVRGAAGVDWYANRDVALTFETAYVLPTGGGIEDLDYIAVQLGFMLRFYAADY